MSKTPVPLAKQYVTHKKCECGCRVQLDDTEKNEICCPICGLVYDKLPEPSERNLPYGCWSKEALYTGKGYTYSEKQFMRQRGINTRTYIGKQELNNMDYQFILDIFKVELNLSKVDCIDVWNIISECKGLNKIHSRLSYEKIILGVCRYVLIQKGIRGYLINLNGTLYKDYNLSRRDYNIIERNIEKYRSLYRCNT